MTGTNCGCLSTALAVWAASLCFGRAVLDQPKGEPEPDWPESSWGARPGLLIWATQDAGRRLELWSVAAGDIGGVGPFAKAGGESRFAALSLTMAPLDGPEWERLRRTRAHHMHAGAAFHSDPGFLLHCDLEEPHHLFASRPCVALRSSH